MKEIIGDLWDYHDKGFPICITTNGTLTKKGNAVMGRGCAKEAKEKYPVLVDSWSNCLVEDGLGVNYVGYNIYSFPVKYNWWEKASLELITQSASKLMEYINLELIKSPIILPRPGCGNGKLSWEKDVKPILEPILDERVWVISK